MVRVVVATAMVNTAEDHEHAMTVAFVAAESG